jgi:hypothetical protein
MLEGELGAGGRVEGGAYGLELTPSRDEVGVQMCLGGRDYFPASSLRFGEVGRRVSPRIDDKRTFVG